jgi:hypothetical protein
MNDRVYYTVEIPYTVVNIPNDSEYWIPFAGESTVYTIQKMKL